MSVLVSLLPVLLSLALLVAVAKLAARLYRQSKLSWAHATGYVVLMVFGLTVLGLLNQLGGSSSPLPVLVVSSLAFHALLGGWYLGAHCRTAGGSRLEFARGAVLAFVYFGVLLAIMAIPALVLLIVRVGHPA